MKKAKFLAILVIAFAGSFAIWAFSYSMTPYVDVQTALHSDSAVQVRGKILHHDAAAPEPYYDPAKGALRFWIEDDKRQRIEVYYHGAKPDAFDTAPETAATGRVRRLTDGTTIFDSNSLVVKCPSKYDDRSSAYKAKPPVTGGAS